MSVRGLFQGHALNAIDAKGRVAIPADLRAMIEANSGVRYMSLSLHNRFACLTGYDRTWAQELNDRIERAEDRAADSDRDFDLDAANMQAFSMTIELPFDASGRFILPDFHREEARLDDLALFLGMGTTFTIWNPRVLLDTPEADPRTKRLAEFLLKQRGAA